MVLWDAGFVIAGLALLVLGGDALVGGAGRGAVTLRISARVVALVVVSVGTSLPELVVSLGSAWRGSVDLAVGNVVGSNVYNVALILGICALVRPLAVHTETLRGDWPVTFAAMAALWLASLDGVVGRVDGALLLCGLVAYLGWTVRRSASQSTPVDDEPGPVPAPLGVAIALVAVGVAALVGGAELVVRGATGIAEGFGVTERVIGLTVVGLGTSLPELFASLVATWRGQDDVAIGNVVGSNLFNTLGIAGGVALVVPLEVGPATVWRDMPVMLGVFAVLLPLMVTGRALVRWEGALLVSAAVGYTGWLLAG